MKMVGEENWFVSVERKDKRHPPYLGYGQHIFDVAEGSPAQALGLLAGDSLWRINGADAGDFDLARTLFSRNYVDYQFYSVSEKSLITVKTRALPLGLKLGLTPEGIILKHKEHGFHNDNGWIKLWDSEDYDSIEKSIKYGNRKSSPGWFKKYFKNETICKYPPANLFLGICKVERGETEEGYRLIDLFGEDRYDWTSDYHALYLTYQALRAKARGNDFEHLNLLTEAFDGFKGSKRLNDMASKIGLNALEFGSWMGEVIFDQETLTYLEGGTGNTQLSKVLDDMPNEKLLPLCLMPWYRSNGPYDDLMSLYGAVAPHMSDRLENIVVVAGEAEKRRDRPYWHEAEDAWVSAGKPCRILHDAKGEYLDQFNLRGSPRLLFVDKSGKVVWDKSMDSDFDYWDMMART